MPSYSIADTKNGLSALIDRALEGEEIVITRHGRPVAELRPLPSVSKPNRASAHEWLRTRRDARPAVTVTSVDVLNQLYEDPIE